MSDDVDKLTIREANITDLEQIVRIWIDGQGSATGSETTAVTTSHVDFFREAIENQSDRFKLWVVSDSTSMLGWQALSPFRNNPMIRPYQAMSSTYVSTRAKGRGVGRRLMRQACQHARAIGLRQVIGYIAENNVAMMRIVQAEGWMRVSEMRPPAPKFHSESLWIYDVSVDRCEDNSEISVPE